MARAVLRAGPVGQADDADADVVGLVGLADDLRGVGALDDGEAPAPARHVDPVLRVVGRVRVRPAHGDPERHAPARRIGAARPVAHRRARPAAGGEEVSQAVVELGAGRQHPRAVALAVLVPELEARRLVELPERPAVARHVLEVQARPGVDHELGPPPAAVDDLAGDHRVLRGAPSLEAQLARPDVLDPVGHEQEGPPAAADLDQAGGRRHAQVRADEVPRRVVAGVGRRQRRLDGEHGRQPPVRRSTW